VLTLQAENVVLALDKFEKVREKRALDEMMGQSKSKAKKVAKVEDEAARKKREAIKQRKYWELLTGILDLNKLSVWRALEKALTKYYKMLVTRQNLIEETGLLNQQNEELKTLLN